jgi:uncharacterized iron-regulated membrane protein
MSGMSIHTSLRKIHRKFAPWLLPFLLLSAITGIVYRIGRSWFGFTKETGNDVLFFHTGSWFGTHGSVLYVIVLGCGLLFMIISGLWMWRASRMPKARIRKSHRLLGVAFSLPLIITAVTGIAYQVGDRWLHLDEKSLKLIMNLHQGSWLGPELRPFYILLIGGSLVFLSLSGLRLWLPVKARGKVS